MLYTNRIQENHLTAYWNELSTTSARAFANGSNLTVPTFDMETTFSMTLEKCLPSYFHKWYSVTHSECTFEAPIIVHSACKKYMQLFNIVIINWKIFALKTTFLIIWSTSNAVEKIMDMIANGYYNWTGKFLVYESSKLLLKRNYLKKLIRSSRIRYYLLSLVWCGQRDVNIIVLRTVGVKRPTVAVHKNDWSYQKSK